MATADLVIALKAVDSATASLNNVAGSLGKMGTAAHSTGPSFASMAGAVGLGVTAAGAFTAAAGAVVGGLQTAVKASADFGQSMANIKATVPKAEFEQFGAQTQALAMRLGKDYPLSASEAGKAMELLAQKGISLSAINNGAAEAVVQLSAATGSDLVTASGIAAVAMDVFRVKESDMTKVTDVMTGSMLRGGVSARDFGFAIQSGGTAVALAGGTIEDASIAIAAMAKAGIEGSDAGTSLKTMYMNLIPTTKAQKQVAEELGLVTKDGTNAFFDASGKVKSYEEISAALAGSLVGLTEKQKLSALETLFGSDAIRAAAVAAKVGAGEFGNLGEQIREPGIAAEAAATKMDTLAGQMKQLDGSVETLQLTLGSKLEPALKNGAKAATEFVNALIDKAEDIDISPFLEATGKAASEASDMFYELGQGASALGEAIADVPIVGEATNDVLQIMGSVATGTAAVLRGDGVGAVEAFGDALSQTGELIGDTASIVDESFTQITEHVQRGTEESVGYLDAGFAGGNDAVLESFGNMVQGAASWAGETLGLVQSTADESEASLTGGFAGAQGGVLDALGTMLGNFNQWSLDAAGVARSAGDGVTTELAAGMDGMDEAASAAGSSAASALDTSIAEMETNAAAAAQAAVGAVSGQVGAAGAAGASVGAAMASGMAGAITAQTQSVVSAAAGMVREGLNAARAVAESHSPSRATHRIGVDFVQGFLNAVEEGAFGEAVTAQVQDMLTAFDDYQIVLGEIGRVEQEVKDIREDAAQAAMDRAQDMIDITSEELRLRKDLAMAEADLIPARQELRDIQRDIRDTEKGGLPTQERVIAINAEINKLKLAELQIDKQMIGVDRRGKEADAVTASKKAIDDQIKSLEIEKREIELGGKIAADAYRIREAGQKAVIETGEKELQSIKNVIEMIDAQQKIFQSEENIIKNATENEIKYRQRLIQVFKDEARPVADRISAGRNLINTMRDEGTITQDVYDEVIKYIGSQEKNVTSTGKATTANKTFANTMKTETKPAIEAVDDALTVLDRNDPKIDVKADISQAAAGVRDIAFQVANVDALAPVVTFWGDVEPLRGSVETAGTWSGMVDALAPIVTVAADISAASQNINALSSQANQLRHPIAMAFAANVPSTVRVDGLDVDRMNTSNADISGVGDIDASLIDANRLETGDAEFGDVEADDFEADDTTLRDVNARNMEAPKAEFEDAEISDSEIEDSQVEQMDVDNFDAGSSNARGGRVSQGGLSLVGEEGPELVAWGANGYVIPNGPSMAMLRGSGSMTADGGTIINVYVAGSVTAEQDLARTIRSELIKTSRANGGLGF